MSNFLKKIKLYHKSSDRHVLVAETDMSYCDIEKIVFRITLREEFGKEVIM